MKSLYVAVSLFLLPLFSSSQVTFTIIEPASIAGGYDFTSNGDGTDWGLPNLLDPADAVMDTLMLVDDGTPGINAQGVPFANEGCNPLSNDLTGKIAVVYRYDGVSSNVCWYGTKVLNAQNAGAIGVLMINRDDNLINVPGTTDGPSTTIPFAFISKSDGEIIRAKMDAGEDVVAFIGNKLGLFNNDAGIIDRSTLAPKLSATSTLTSQNSGEFTFDVGTQIYNYGSSDQNNVTVTASVTGPGTNWVQSAGPFSILSGDSIDVFTGGSNNIPAFTASNYPAGKYTLSYTVDLGITDEADYDNTMAYNFLISDTIVSYARFDTVTHLPMANANYRPGGGAVEFNSCMVFNDANGSRVAAEGIYFSALTGYGSGIALTGEEMALNLYRWEDNFTDLNDANLDFAALNPVGYGYYYYPADLQGQVVYGALDFPVQLEDNQRYLACVSNSNTNIYLGYDSRTDYTRNIDHYLQPICPISSDGTYYAIGFGSDLSPAIALRVFDASEMSLNEEILSSFSIYPNPAVDVLHIKGNDVQITELIVEDLNGKKLIQIQNSENVTSTIDVSSLKKGQYIVRVIQKDGLQLTRKFTKI